MKSARLHAAFVRKREADQLKQEKSIALQRYYDKWGRITSQYEHWSTPQYYKASEESSKNRLQKEQKQKSLEERQAKLKQMLDEENQNYEREMKEKSRPKIKHAPNNVLENIRQTLYTASDVKRPNDMESSLYTKWRFGQSQDQILRESKSQHQPMAKLSWLDRQVEKEMIREKEKRENNELELKLQHERRKHEEYIKSAHEMKNSEIEHLKGFQETHVLELKNRERESHDLKLQENILRRKLEEIKKEIDTISMTGRVRRDRVVALNNYRKLKMLLKSRCEAMQSELKHDINILNRISLDREFDNEEEISYLRMKFETQLENEKQNHRNIEMMYESEAKHSLAKQEEKWNEDSMVREQQLKCLMDARIETLNDKINAGIKRQQELIGIRDSHLKAIEQANERLKTLMSASINDEYNNLVHSDLNGNYEQELIKKTEKMMVRPNPDLCVPKFGRKRIVWT